MACVYLGINLVEPKLFEMSLEHFARVSYVISWILGSDLTLGNLKRLDIFKNK